MTKWNLRRACLVGTLLTCSAGASGAELQAEATAGALDVTRRMASGIDAVTNTLFLTSVPVSAKNYSNMAASSPSAEVRQVAGAGDNGSSESMLTAGALIVLALVLRRIS